MKVETSPGEIALPQPQSRSGSASLIVRRVHMFLGLFLAPWMAMYALSTLVMTHREWVNSFYPTKSPSLITERELDYSRAFAESTTPQEMARQILRDLGLDGSHWTSGGKQGKALVIHRQHPVHPRQITFEPKSGKVRIQREEFRAASFLERMHRRRGYEQPYALEDTWAASVDLAVVAMVFWSLSGIWLWWEIGPSRRWGTLSLVLGAGSFALFLLLL